MADDLPRDVHELEALVHIIEMRQATVIARLDRAEEAHREHKGEYRNEYRDLRAHMDTCFSRVEQKIETLRQDSERRFNWHGRAGVGILVALIMNLIAVLVSVVPRFLFGTSHAPPGP